MSRDQCGARLPRSAPSPRRIVAERAFGERPPENEREAFIQTQNIRMRDIWKTSNELERQGSSKLIWFAPGRSEKPLVFTLCRGAPGRNKEGEPCIQGPFLSINKKNAGLRRYEKYSLRSSTLLQLQTSRRRLLKNRNASSCLSANISRALTFLLRLRFECESAADSSRPIDVQPGRNGGKERERKTRFLLCSFLVFLKQFLL